MRVQFLWFEDCPNHAEARKLLVSVLAARNVDRPIEDIDASDPAIAEQLQFAGSPSIRIDGEDIEPNYVDPGTYAPRCRLYLTDAGLRGTPERRWIEDAVERALRADEST